MIEIVSNYWKPAIEIAILWFCFYVILLFVKETRGFQVLNGIIILALIFLITQKLELDTINWILRKLFAISVIGILIIFQPEFRRALANIGQNRLFGFFLKETEMLSEIVKSCTSLSKKKIGALIAFERETKLSAFIESGITVDGRISSEFINTVFMPNTPLHDGGIIISGNRIAAAGCLFPLTQNPKVSKTLGTRHRAALGLSEESDAIVIVISEETGGVSVAVNGRLTRDLDSDSLMRVLKNFFSPKRGSRVSQTDKFLDEKLVIE